MPGLFSGRVLEQMAYRSRCALFFNHLVFGFEHVVANNFFL